MEQQLIAVLAEIEGELGTEVLGYWDVLERELGVNTVRIFDRPTLTLQGGVIEAGKLQILVDNFPRLGSGVKPFPLEVTGFGHLEEHSLFLKVEPTAEVLAVNMIVNSFLGIFCSELMGDYAPERYIPHVPLAMEDLKGADLARALARFAGVEPGTEHTVTNLCLMRFEEDGHLTLLARADLKSPVPNP